MAGRGGGRGRGGYRRRGRGQMRGGGSGDFKKPQQQEGGDGIGNNRGDVGDQKRAEGQVGGDQKGPQGQGGSQGNEQYRGGGDTRRSSGDGEGVGHYRGDGGSHLKRPRGDGQGVGNYRGDSSVNQKRPQPHGGGDGSRYYRRGGGGELKGPQGNGQGVVSTGPQGSGQGVVSTGPQGSGHGVVSTGPQGSGQGVVTTGPQGSGQGVVSTGPQRRGNGVASTGPWGGGNGVVSTGPWGGGNGVVSTGPHGVYAEFRKTTMMDRMSFQCPFCYEETSLEKKSYRAVRYDRWLKHLISSEHQYKLREFNRIVRDQQTLDDDFGYVISRLPKFMPRYLLEELMEWVAEFGVVTELMYMRHFGVCYVIIQPGSLGSRGKWYDLAHNFENQTWFGTYPIIIQRKRGFTVEECVDIEPNGNLKKPKAAISKDCVSTGETKNGVEVRKCESAEDAVVLSEYPPTAVGTLESSTEKEDEVEPESIPPLSIDSTSKDCVSPVEITNVEEEGKCEAADGAVIESESPPTASVDALESSEEKINDQVGTEEASPPILSIQPFTPPTVAPETFDKELNDEERSVDATPQIVEIEPEPAPPLPITNVCVFPDEITDAEVEDKCGAADDAVIESESPPTASVDALESCEEKINDQVGMKETGPILSPVPLAPPTLASESCNTVVRAEESSVDQPPQVVKAESEPTPVPPTCNDCVLLEETPQIAKEEPEPIPLPHISNDLVYPGETPQIAEVETEPTPHPYISNDCRSSGEEANLHFDNLKGEAADDAAASSSSAIADSLESEKMLNEEDENEKAVLFLTPFAPPAVAPETCCDKELNDEERSVDATPQIVEVEPELTPPLPISNACVSPDEITDAEEEDKFEAAEGTVIESESPPTASADALESSEEKINDQVGTKETVPNVSLVPLDPAAEAPESFSTVVKAEEPSVDKTSHVVKAEPEPTSPPPISSDCVLPEETPQIANVEPEPTPPTLIPTPPLTPVSDSVVTINFSNNVTTPPGNAPDCSESLKGSSCDQKEANSDERSSQMTTMQETCVPEATDMQENIYEGDSIQEELTSTNVTSTEDTTDSSGLTVEEAVDSTPCHQYLIPDETSVVIRGDTESQSLNTSSSSEEQNVGDVERVGGDSDEPDYMKYAMYWYRF